MLGFGGEILMMGGLATGDGLITVVTGGGLAGLTAGTGLVITTASLAVTGLLALLVVLANAGSFPVFFIIGFFMEVSTGLAVAGLCVPILVFVVAGFLTAALGSAVLGFGVVYLLGRSMSTLSDSF